MKGRLIAIGDIHGCHAEFVELLERLNPSEDDELILLGDLVNRGPDSLKVIDEARARKARALLGNHELRLLKHRRTGNQAYLRNGDERTFRELRPQDWSYIEAMPLTHFCEELNTVLVHGGFLPTEAWWRQPASVVTRIQVIDPEGRPRKRADSPGSPSWADFWCGPPFVIYGHTPRPDVYRLKWSLGIDTGCVQGGALTAYILPERRIVQVKAKRRYYP